MKINIINILIWIGVAIITIDMVGAMMWAVTGQTPQDGFYIGAITNGVIHIFKK